MKKLLQVFALLAVAGLFLPGCAPTSANCGKPEVFCVGLVTSGGHLEDDSYNQAAWNGVRQSKTSGVADWIGSIETVDVRDYEENIRVFGDAGYDVIVTVGTDIAEATLTEANAYPGIYFIGVDQDQSANQEYTPNLVGLIFREDEIGYLAGALAASLTKTGEIAAVLGSDASPAMQRYGQGFINGAISIDPALVPTVLYHNDVGAEKSLDDPEWGAEQANSLVDTQVDILFGAGGKTGSYAIVAAVMRGAYAIGADTDEYYSLPVAAPHLYTSVTKQYGPGISELIKAAKDAQAQTSGFPSGNYTGSIGLAPYHDLESSVTEEVKQHMTDLLENLSTGDIQTGVP
jgi:basic membrane protein A